MDPELKAKLDEVKSLVTGIQAKHDELTAKYGEDVAKNDTSIKAMETKVGELTQAIEDATAKVAEEKTAADEVVTGLNDQIKELGLAVARGGNQNSTVKAEDMEMSDDVKSMFGTALRQNKGTYNIDLKVAEEIIREHVKVSLTHLPEERQDVLVKSILAEGSNPAGGMWCPVPVDARIRKRVFETSPMRQLAEVMTVTVQAMKFALDDEELVVTAAAEVDTRNETDAAEFGEVEIGTHELYAKPKATLQVLEDSTLNLEAWLANKASTKIGRSQNTAFVVGNGAKQARGILDYGEAAVEVYERGKIGTQSTAASITIAGDDLIDLQSHLLEDYQANATWLMHRLIWAKIMKLKDDEGRYLIDPLILFNGTGVPQLLGTSVRMAGDMPKPDSAGALTANAKYIAYGDFREGYTILDRLGINVIMDNITQSGFVKWFFRTRYGGGVTNFQAYKILKAKA